MLKKNSKITFGGMWVFPGGKIDPEDYGEESDLEYAARAAAVRETKEETGISLDSKDFIHFSFSFLIGRFFFLFPHYSILTQ